MKKYVYPKKELYSIIQNLLDELSTKVIDYIEYLKFVYATNTAPDNIVIKSKEDLIEKLEEGMKDTNSGKICSIDEAFAEVSEILAN